MNSMNKKGLFFIFISLFITILLIAVVSTRQTYRYSERSDAIKTRVETMDNFIDDFNKDFDRAIYIGGYRALLSVYAHMRDKGNYIDDFDELFSEILLNGTANNTPVSLMQEGTEGASIQSWLARVNEEANDLNIDATINISRIHVTQNDPWSIAINVDTDVIIEDTKGLAKWDFTKTYTRKISIIGFEDPIYIVNTEDKITNLINITPDMDFVNDADNDTTILVSHLMNSYYIASNTSPTFLMRFVGNFSPSENGIESMVDLEYLNSQSIPLNDKSVIDYIYFSNLTSSDNCNVTGMPSWFRIDDDHVEVYEIDRLETLSCS
jgi:hypothetical protein